MLTRRIEIIFYKVYIEKVIILINNE